jgi:hypothetical protein
LNDVPDGFFYELSNAENAPTCLLKKHPNSIHPIKLDLP